MKFGPWLPDLPEFGHEGLVLARNVFATPLGYGPVKSYSAVTEALPSTWRGGKAFVGVDGTSVFLAGLDTGLYSYASGVWTQEVAGSYTGKWQFAQFGDLAIATQGGAPLKYTITSGAGTTLGGTPPNGRFVSTVKDFVFISGVADENSTVYWCAINNVEGWTVGTDQSDKQRLPDGGEITGQAGGEYALVFQRDQIWRAQYVGPPFIYQFDKVAQGVGCIAPNSICQAGRTVFFLSARGFCSFTDGAVELIGANQIDTTFFAQYGQPDIETSISAAVDPIRKLAVWSMPSRLWAYNFELKRWTDVEEDIFGVSTGTTVSVSLEDIDTLFPGGIDTVPGSLDDPIYKGGVPFLAVIANDGSIGTFGSQTNLEAYLKTAQLEPVKGRDTRIRAVRVDTDGYSDVWASLETRKRLGDAPTTSTGSNTRGNGDIPVRGSGRYIQPTVRFLEGADWSFAEGFEMIAARGAKQ